MKLEIQNWSAEIMNAPTRPVTKINDNIRVIAENMARAMKTNNGIGIAANQVNHNHRMAIVQTKDEGSLCIINPVIISTVGIQTLTEGCLSVPWFQREIKRAFSLKLEFLDLNNQVRVKEFEGLEAACVQHEVDHLNGISIMTKEQK